HDRGLVVLELRIVRQFPREMPEQAGGGGDADQENDGPAGEHPPHEAQQSSHGRYPRPRIPIRVVPPRMLPATAGCGQPTTIDSGRSALMLLAAAPAEFPRLGRAVLC